MDTAADIKQPSLIMEHMAKQSAREKANIARWGINVVIFLFALLVTIIILVSYDIGIHVVALLAISGLGGVWLWGRRRGSQLYQRFYTEELSGLKQMPSKEAIELLIKLTAKQIKILNYIAQGYFNKQIAVELGVAESTIKTHVTTILNKLNANDRTEAVVTAIKHGLIPVG